MKILLLADIESKALWDYYRKEELEGIDLIISCGDLNAEYLTFIATMASVPVLYVHGNHDAKYRYRAPEGCICIDDMVYTYKGIRFLGLGGSMRYKQDDWQYTENEMRGRVKKLWFPLLWNRGFDVLVTHSPARHFHDAEDLPHVGFEIFTELMDKYKPKYFVHGHVHKNYDRNFAREDKYNDTKVVNGYERWVIEI